MSIETKDKHIAVLAFPFSSHPAQLLTLVRSISTSAPHVSFSFLSTAESNKSVFSNVIGIDNKVIKSYNVANGFPENHVFSGNPQEPVDMFLKATPGNFEEAIEVAVKESGKRVTCLMTDAFLWFAAEMAQRMGVPWVPLWTAAPHSILAHAETDLIRQKLGLNELEDKTIDFLPGFSPIRIVDLPEGIVSGDLSSPFPTMLHKMGLTLPQATVVATSSFESLDPISVEALKSKFRKFLNVGPFALTSPDPVVSDPQGCLEWLENKKQQSVVYISFGTVICLPPRELEALSQALEESPFTFIWSFRGNPEEKLPSGFLERTKDKGKVVSWAPQLKVLEHEATGLFLTHCGWNSVLESIIGGVPMICRPLLGDNPLNTRIVEAVWGIGKAIEGGKITKDSLIKAFKQVLASEEGKNMRIKLKGLKDMALDAVKPNGNSSQNFKTLVEVVTK